MQFDLCAECYLQGYCRNLQSRIVTDDELTTQFIADVRAYMRGKGLGRDAWKPFLIDGYQDYPGRIVDKLGHEMMLPTKVFDLRSIAYWFRDLCRAVPPGVRLRLRRSARKRFIVTASILRALDPVAASLWGKDIANDNDGSEPIATKPVAGCRYAHFAYQPSGSN